jgi:hypothetical protein
MIDDDDRTNPVCDDDYGYNNVIRNNWKKKKQLLRA